MNFSSSEWMQNANVKLAMYVFMACLPTIVADLSASRVSVVTIAIVILNGLTAAKAFMSSPDSPPPLLEIKGVVETVSVSKSTVSTEPKADEVKP